MESSKDKSENKCPLNHHQIEGIIRKGKKEGRKLGAMEIKGAFYSFQIHSINEEDLIQMYGDYFSEVQLDYQRHNSYYKMAVTGFRHAKDKIIAVAKVYDEKIDPDDDEEEIKFTSSMYLNFAKDKPDIGIGIDILEEIGNLENVVATYESLEEKKRRIDAVINEVNEKLNNKEAEKESIIDGDCQIFNTVWEAVLYHSVLVDVGIRRHYSKKEIPELVGNMFLIKQEKKISHHSFYNKLLAMPKARRGEKTNEGRYGISDYESVKKVLSTEFPEALSILKDRYFYSQLC